MQTTGVSLLLDLSECKSPLNNEAVLEQLFSSALEFGGFELVDHYSNKFHPNGATQVFILRQSHATFHVWSDTGFVAVDIFSTEAPNMVRPALEIIRGYLTQKLLARTVKAQLIDRGT